MKLDRVNNPMYGSKVLNCFLLLAVSRQMKTFEFVLSNLVMLGKWHCERIMAKKRPAPIIDMSKEHIVNFVLQKFVLIRAKCEDPKIRIAFTVGVDATVLVQSW